MNKRKLAWMLAILAFFMFVGSPFQLAAKAVAGVDDSILLIILAALAAMGITFEMTGGIRTVLNWLSGQIDEAGIDFSGIQYGANSQGNILLNNRFLTMISTLALYIRNKLQLTDNSTVVISQAGNVAGSVYAYQLPIEFTSNNGTRYTILSSNPNVYVFFNYSNSQKTHIRPVIFSYGSNTFQYLRYNNSMDNPYTESSHEANGGNYVWDGNYINIDGTANSYSQDFNGIVVHDYSINSSDIRSWLEENVFGTGIESTNGLSASAGTIEIPTGNDINGKGGILTLPVPWGTSLSGALSRIPGLVLQDDLAGQTDLTIDNEQTVAEQISEEATNSQEVSQEVSDYQVSGLASVFPFCIPFDIYSFVSCLAAEPVAPSFQWRFYVPNVCDETITLDLSQFDTVAQIVRTMELLAFIVGLAFITRDKMIRG